MTSNELNAFLVEYAARLMGCGATCIRIEKNLGRIAAAYGVRAECVIMPRHIRLYVATANEPYAGVTLMAPVGPAHIDFDRNTRLSALSWEIADRGLCLDAARERFAAILQPAPRRSDLLLSLAVAAANASFCALFGGDMAAMTIVGIATAAGFGLKQWLLKRGVDVRVTFMLCAFVSAVLATADFLFSVGSTPDVALATAVLYLVPGIPFINSFSDLIYRHYVCALSRLVDAAVLTCCLSAGLCAAMLAMQVGMF